MKTRRQRIVEGHYGFFEGMRSAFDLFGNRSNAERLRQYFGREYIARSLREDWNHAVSDMKKAFDDYEKKAQEIRR